MFRVLGKEEGNYFLHNPYNVFPYSLLRASKSRVSSEGLGFRVRLIFEGGHAYMQDSLKLGWWPLLCRPHFRKCSFLLLVVARTISPVKIVAVPHSFIPFSPAASFIGIYD